jgi:phage shock protein E
MFMRFWSDTHSVAAIDLRTTTNNAVYKTTLYRRASLVLIAGVLLSSKALAVHAEVPETPVNSVSHSTPVQAQQVLWIDVRSEAEYLQGHLPGAILIPHDTIADNIAQWAPDKSQPIQLYCRSGRRSGIAAQVLKDLGYNKVTNAGGYEQIKEEQIKEAQQTQQHPKAQTLNSTSDE